MKRLFWLVGLMLVTPMLVTHAGNPPVIDKVYLSLSAKHWVKTQTVQLQVAVNATLNDADMVETRKHIMSQLSSIAKGEWHITQFNRSQDGSGLEKLTAKAQARVKQTELNQVYQRVKSVSKPGLSYQVSTINFEPSLADIEKGQAILRKKLYQQASAELVELNRQYPKQGFSLYQIVFTQDGQSMPLLKKQSNNRMMMAVASVKQPQDVSVSNELTLKAIVILAADRVGHQEKNDD